MTDNSKETNFNQDWNEIKHWISSHDVNIEKSSMWKNLIKDFEISGIANHKKDFLFKPNSQRGYGFVLKSEETISFLIEKKILEFTHFLTRCLNYMRGRIYSRNLSGLGNNSLTCHPTGLYWLNREGLFESYKEYCNSNGFSFCANNGAKLFYISSLFDPLIGQKNVLNILEIGAGVGTLAGILKYRFSMIKTYIIVDLPEMLLNSSLTLNALFPDVPIYFVFPGKKHATSFDKPGFYLCVPQSTDEIPNDEFDFALNIDSFQEMTETQVEQYISLIQRSVRNGGHFINLNRRKKLDEENFDNNPLCYPYYPENKILKWETDRFMDRTINYSKVRTDGSLLRIEQVRKRKE